MTHGRFSPAVRALRPAAPLCLLAALAAALAAAPAAAQTHTDDLVPAGAWRLRAEVRYDRQDDAYTRKNKTGTLKDYVIPDDATRAQIDGDLTREIVRAEVHLQYGRSDTWNWALAVPFLHMEQRSSLEAAPGADAKARATAERLGDRELSGLGDATLTSLHRPLFSDRHAWVLGYGLRVPLGEPESTYDGAGTFDLRSPGAALFALAHYTYFPAWAGRNRMDLRLLTGKGFETTVDTPQGEATLLPGNFTEVGFSWTAEVARVLMGFDLEHLVTTQNILASEVQHDPTLETRARLRVGHGNLADLEAGPIAFPYQWWVGAETSLQGFNRPLSRGITFVFHTFF